MENFIFWLTFFGLVAIALFSLYWIRKTKDKAWTQLGEEHRPFNSYQTPKTVISSKGDIDVSLGGKPDKCFPPKEFGLTKGTKYQKQKSCL